MIYYRREKWTERKFEKDQDPVRELLTDDTDDID